MAFMMPVVKQDYNIYPTRRSGRDSILSSSPGSTGSRTPQSRDSILSRNSNPQSRDSILSSSPGAASFTSSPRRLSSSIPKSESHNSLHRFHSKVLDKLRRTFRSKSGSSDDINQASTSSPVTIR